MRVLPILILVLFASFLLRAGEIYTETREGAGWFASAQAEEEEPAGEEEHADEGKDKKKDDAKKDEKADAKDDDTNTSDAPPVQDMTNNCQFSDIEVDLLQSLSARRKELEGDQEKLDLRETILRATEERVEKRVRELEQLKAEVDSKLKQYDEQEEKKMASMVKIYENMKPKDAAKIFEELDMDILLQVVDRMGERKIAPILADMSPKRAQEITVKLAEYRSLPKPDKEEDKAESEAGSPAAPPAMAPIPEEPAPEPIPLPGDEAQPGDTPTQ